MAITCLISQVLSIYWVILFLRIILSWTTMFWSPPPALTPAIRVIYELTEPVLSFFRRFIPPLGALDISPLVIFLLLGAAQRSLPC